MDELLRGGYRYEVSKETDKGCCIEIHWLLSYISVYESF